MIAPVNSLDDALLGGSAPGSGAENDGQLSFRQLGYSVPIGSYCFDKHQKQILLNLTGQVPKDRVTALFGPTGSGKSTLLDILAARKDPRNVEGVVLVDGVPRKDKVFRRTVGYVVQENILMGNLTCEENVRFSASLRLSDFFSNEERERRVQAVLANLGLAECAETLVGDQFVRGLSGGEKKRTQIACEMVINPKFLLLDEPTSGLDAYNAVRLVEELGRLARTQHVTVLMSIHQPRFSIWKQLDNILVLSRGQLIYSGAAANAVKYLGGIGYCIEANDNPADFLLDVLSGIIDRQEVADSHGRRDSSGSTGSLQSNTTVDNAIFEALHSAENKATRTHAILLSAWEDRQDDQHLYLAPTPLSSPVLATDGVAPDERISLAQEPLVSIEQQDPFHAAQQDSGSFKRPGFFAQFRIISGKTLTGMRRVPHIIILQLCAMVFFALITGGIYYQMELDQTGLQNRLGAFFFIIMSGVFSNLNGIELFLKERALFIHQRANGYYNTGPYLFAMFVCDLLPLRIFPMLAYVSILYPLMGFQSIWDNFFWFALTLVVECICSGTLCYLMSAAIGNFMLANLAVSVVYVVTMIFGGLLVNIKDLPVYVHWLQYVSFFRFGYEALCTTEMHGLTFNTTIGPLHVPVTGDQILEDRGLSLDNRPMDIFAMLLMTMVFTALSYFCLDRLTAAQV